MVGCQPYSIRAGGLRVFGRCRPYRRLVRVGRPRLIPSLVVLGFLPWCEVSKKIGIRKVIHRKKVRIISPVRKDKIVKARNESKKTNFMTPHNSNTLDLVFVMGCWHAYAKLRVHTEHTLTSFEQITSDLGVLLRRFTRVTCTAFKTTELPRERAARIRRAARNPGPAAAGPKIKTFNMNTYKVHALGDYPQTIRERGTTDNYTTRRASTIYTYLCPTPVTDFGLVCRLKLNIGAPKPYIQGSTSMILNVTLESFIGARKSSDIWIG